MTMRKYRFTIPLLFGLCLVALAGRPPQANAAAAVMQIPALAPGMARVWFLRPSEYLYIAGADPTVYANGAPVGDLRANTEFSRDFPAGTYRFTVQPYGTPTGQADTVQLAAGADTYLEIQWAPSWELGYPDAGPGYGEHTFAVLTMSPQLAQAYLSTLTYLGAAPLASAIAQRGQGE
jgi:hypothetical protein